MNVGLIGCGAIGRTLAKAIINRKAGDITLTALCDIDEARLDSLYRELGQETIITTQDSTSLIENPEIDLVIEAATKEAVKEIAEKALDHGKNLLIMSAGAFTDENLYNVLSDKAGKKN
jgi:aspartate dehydrogenase